MKIFPIILILIFSFFFFSCKHNKEIVKTNTTVNTDSIVKTDIVQTNHVLDLIQTETTFTANEIKTDFSEETITVIEYSIPDSTGNQYVIKETSINRNINSETKNNITYNDSDSSIHNSQTIIEDNTTIDYNKKIKKQTFTKSKQTNDFIIPIIIISLLIVLALFFIIRFFIKNKTFL